MSYCGYITTLKNVRKHPNADRLQLADIFGSTICVSLDYTEGQVVVYFPPDGQLSAEFCEVNNLIRKKDENGNNIGGYFDADKRNVVAIKLRGERSDGLALPIECLSSFGDISTLSIGDTIDTFNGHEICKKYIPRRNPQKNYSSNSPNKKKKVKKVEYPYFSEHIDTPQLRFCMEKFKPGDIICLTEKVHGTSSRNALTPVVREKKNIFNRIFKTNGKKVINWEYAVGTRRTVVETLKSGYYGDNAFRIRWGERFNGKLHDGEEVFGEIAGFTDDMVPIMGIVDNKKTNDKEFIKKYGDRTLFSYGCNEETKSRYFVYRMTCTTPDGYTIEYPWDLVKIRAEMMGLEVVPELERFIYTTEEDFLARIQKWLDIPSTIDSSHVIEGVVVRALNDTGFRVAKSKSYTFQVIEGIIKAEANAPDMEEAQEISNEDK